MEVDSNQTKPHALLGLIEAMPNWAIVCHFGQGIAILVASPILAPLGS